MHALDSTGRQVSLLNDEPTSGNYFVSLRPRLAHRAAARPRIGAYPAYVSSRSNSSSPVTPELTRSDSYDSQASADPASPLTPSNVTYDYASHAHSYHSMVSYDYAADPAAVPLPTFVDPKYDDDALVSSAPLPEKPGKRYPCRYRDTHGCDKTFTTSGHASRHSKIHTAEKAVQCTHPGCKKKFTRADNMKQHLETHFKDRSRSSGSQRSLSSSSSSSSSSSTKSAGSARRPSAASTRTNSSASLHSHHHHQSAPEMASWRIDPSPSPSPSPYLPSPKSSCSAWNGRPAMASRTTSGLDALAMAIACQEGGNC